MPRPSNAPAYQKLGRPRAWSIGGDRESRISDPTTAFTPRFVEKRAGFRCIKPRCTATVDGAALFCPLHLWTFDNPTLEKAPLVFDNENALR